MKFAYTMPTDFYVDESAFPQPDMFEQGLRWLSQNAFDGFEPCVSSYKNIDVRAIKQMADELRLAIPNISTGKNRRAEGLSLASPDKAVLERTMIRYNKLRKFK